MTNLLEGKSVFVHWKLAEAGFDNIVEALKMKPVDDVFEEATLDMPIEERFIRSGTDVAFVNTLPFIFQDSTDLLESAVLHSRGVLVAHSDSHEAFKRFNKSLEDRGFLYLWLNQVSDGHTLANLFLKALQNV